MKRGALWSGVLIAAVVAGLAPFGATFWWGFELFTHFRVQYVIVGIALAGLAAATNRRSVAVALVVVAALNARPILPYLPLANRTAIASASGPTPVANPFEVLTINVNAQNMALLSIANAVRSANADLVAIVELTPELDAALPDWQDRYPHSFTAAANGNFGIGILSRYPLREAREFLTGPTSAIDSVVELPSGSIRMLAAHLYPPMGQTMADTRNRQLDQLAAYAKDIEGPLLVCGDLNLSPYSPYFDRFTEAAELMDARLRRGLDFSWPSFFPLAGIPIDHCLFRGPLAVESIKRLDPFGSDHYPVKVSLTWQEYK